MVLVIWIIEKTFKTTSAMQALLTTNRYQGIFHWAYLSLVRGENIMVQSVYVNLYNNMVKKNPVMIEQQVKNALQDIGKHVPARGIHDHGIPDKMQTPDLKNRKAVCKNTQKESSMD